MKAKEKMMWIIIVLAAAVYLFPGAQNRLAFAQNRPAAHETAPDFLLNPCLTPAKIIVVI